MKRRLTVIMFSDIAGYTALMQENEQHALKSVEHYKQVLKEKSNAFDGEIIKHLGDGNVTIFESVYQAVKCALEIQLELQTDPQVPVRIGMHTGEVIFSEDDFFGNTATQS